MNFYDGDLVAPAKLSSSPHYKPASRPNKHTSKYSSSGLPFSNHVHIITDVVPQAAKPHVNQPKLSPNRHPDVYKSSSSGGGGGGGEVDMDMIRNILTQVLKHLEQGPQNGKYTGNQKRHNSYPAHSHHHSSYEDRGTSSVNSIQYRPLVVRPSLSRPNYQAPLPSALPPSPAMQAKLRNKSPYSMQSMGFVGEDGLIAIPLPPNVVKFNFFGKKKSAKRKPCKEDEYKRKADY